MTDMMKYTCAFLFIIGLSGSAHASTTRMSCHLNGDALGYNVHFKYEDKFLISDNAYARLEGKWVNICVGIEKNIGQITTGKIDTWSTVEDMSATCIYVFPSDSFGELKWLIDFETKTWSQYKNGQLFNYLNLPTSGKCE